MKKLVRPGTFLLSILAILLASCSSKTVVRSSPPPPPPPPVVIVEKKETHLPPGQAKKIYGEKSAKDFAPGQQKKRGNYPLIIVVNTTMKVTVIGGKRCYKNDDEVVYWEGTDKRFYVDEKFMPENYDKKEYDDWNKNKGKSNRKDKDDDDDDDHGNGHGKGHGKGKDKNDDR